MKKFKLKKFYSLLVLFFILIYLELIFRLFTNNMSFSFTIIILITSLSIFINAFTKLFNNNINKVLYLIIIFLICFIYSLQLCVYKMFGFYFDWSLLYATNQVASFAGDGIMLIIENILGVFLLELPFIILLIFNKNIILNKDKWYISIIKFILSILSYVIFLGLLNINKSNSNSNYRLYYEVNNIELNIHSFGTIHAFLIDTERAIFGFKEKINIQNNEGIDVTEEYVYNNLDIDFNYLIENEGNNVVKEMHAYFQNESGTLQNEYTNYFEGKNLILFMAESFNEIAVREDLTPTLYKLVNSGFKFTRFYTPTISSTIGGEFQELTGLVAAAGFLKPWKSGENYYPFGIAKSFAEIGYNTYAYHDHNYYFQSRNKYLSALGFTNFKGCNNGLEEYINCHQWPESDVEMINATINDFIASDKPFFTYYVTVSGHGDYGFSKSSMAKKHKSDVANLNYSEKPLAYLAAQIELDQALELLINKLAEAGILDNTIIALVGDHYPYYLSIDEVNEIASYEKDAVVEVNHSNFILWNNKMDTIIVDKVGSQIDVLPTLYNLFGVPYDSRLIIGKDILSTEGGLAIFGNGSWVSDYGTYYANSKKYIGEYVSDDYVEQMTNKVNNKMTMSKYIMTYDYYRKVFGE